jgi:hypothetical protein
MRIDYLWIDSLCIIQDLKEDWKKEALTMGTVYEQATLTIAASEARTARDGCFSLANPLINNPCCIAGSEEQELWVSEPEGDALGRTTICRRAWTLQERWLSRRVPHFDPGGML